MSSITLSWLKININGQETSKQTSQLQKTAITCGFSGPRYDSVIFFDWDFLIIGHRCDLHITGSFTLDIEIQVELEVTHVAYSALREKDKRALMIFSVMINRPCSWAGNNSEHLSHFPNVAN
jgi:hypothetical protein